MTRIGECNTINFTLNVCYSDLVNTTLVLVWSKLDCWNWDKKED